MTLFCIVFVFGRVGRVKEIGGWAEGPSRALALEDFGRIRYPESHRSRTQHM